MREIKFRAWDGEVMYEWLSLKQKQQYLSFVDNAGGWTIMQYTGLKDKNGVEVYEGDILKETLSSQTLGTADTRVHEVTWGTEFAGFNLGTAPHWSVLNPHDLQRMEVIGNIYENPELVK